MRRDGKCHGTGTAGSHRFSGSLQAGSETHVVSHGSMQVNKSHKKSAILVKAQTQAELIKILEPELTPLEHSAYKRGRNAKSVTMAKHATMSDYRMATGVEALMG